jgi:hypothetical protein
MGHGCVSFKSRLRNAREAVVDGAEDVANDRAKQHEDRNNNDSDQNKDQRVFYQTLTFFFRGEQHGFFSFLENFKNYV